MSSSIRNGKLSTHTTNSKATTVVRSLRISLELDKRIDELATKSLITKNAWINRTLIREAGLRNV
jgi:predicted DNA-binding protein